MSTSVPEVRRILGAAGVSFLAGAVYLVPQILAWADGYPFAYFHQADEPAYAAQLERMIQGFTSLGDIWTYEGRDGISAFGTLPERVMSIPASIFGMDTETVVVLSRWLLPALSVFLFGWTLAFLGVPWWTAYLLACSAWLLPGVFYYKPFLSWTREIIPPFNRFSNPLFGHAVFFAAWLAGAGAFLGGRCRDLWAVVSGVLLGALFYVSVYYWTHLGAVFLLSGLFIRVPGRFRTLAVGAAATAVTVIPYVFYALALREHPVFPYFAWRNGLMIPDSGSHLLDHKALIALGASGMILVVASAPRWRYLGWSVAGGWLCYFSTVVTGIGLQNFHWHYTLAPVSVAAAFVSLVWLYRRIEGRWRPPLELRRSAPVVSVAAFVLVFVTGVRAGAVAYEGTEESPELGVGVLDAPYEGAFRWIRDHTARDSVILASPSVMHLIPVRTGRRIWLSRGAQMTPFEEILDRNVLLWRAAGMSGADVREYLAPGGFRPIATWAAGLTGEMKRDLDRRGLPPFDSALSAEFADRVARYYGRLSPGEIEGISRRYRIDYVLLGPLEERWIKRPDAWFTTESVFHFGGVEILKVLR